MKVKLNYIDQLKFKASAREFHNIELDEPESFHGTNLAPSPIEYVLIGIGGCLGSTFNYCLQKQKIELKNLEIIVDGLLKHIPPKMHLRLVEINIEFQFSLEKDGNSEGLEYCIKEFKSFCPIYDPIIKGLSISINFNQI